MRVRRSNCVANPSRRTGKIKAMADIRPLAIDDTDSIIRAFHLDLQPIKEQEVV